MGDGSLRHAIWLAGAGYVALIACSALLSAFQVAVVCVRRSRLSQLADAGNTAATRALVLVEQPEPFLDAEPSARIARIVVPESEKPQAAHTERNKLPLKRRARLLEAFYYWVLSRS